MHMDEEAQKKLREEVDAALHKAPKPKAPQQLEQNSRSSIKYIIGVVSGKGGVGKSLVTGTLAVSLARKGYSVAILDADVTGPSIPKMMGLSGQRAYGIDDMLVPLETANHIKIMSANLVLEKETDPVLWRGPVVAGAIKQFYSDCIWGDIDYMLVDMPPGTSDVALTVFQTLPLQGLVIVSSPQDLVQMIVGKAVGMANLMHVPVLGLVENMAYVRCPNCDENIEVFGPSRLHETAQVFDLNELDQIPMDPQLAAACDAGTFETDMPDKLLPKALHAIEETCSLKSLLDNAR